MSLSVIVPVAMPDLSFLSEEDEIILVSSKLLVWQARYNDILIISVGWLKTTLEHLLKTYEQAFPRMMRMKKGIK